MDINERIYELRSCLNLSRRAFGEKLGVSGDVINNIENNRLKRPEQKEPIYKLICETFNVSEDWLKNGNGEMFKTFPETDELTEYIEGLLMDTDDKVYDIMRSFLLVYGRLDDVSKKVLQNTADELLKEIKKRARLKLAPLVKIRFYKGIQFL